MTKGHFHTILDTGEVYYCLAGQGAMLMETPEGEVSLVEMKPGEAVYVPPRWAHRSINTGKEPLVTFFAFLATPATTRTAPSNRRATASWSSNATASR